MSHLSHLSNSGLRPIPKFESEAQEREFWETHDSTDYVDWSKAERVRFPKLKPSSANPRRAVRGAS